MRKSPIAPAEVDVGSVPVHIRPARADEAEFLTGLSLRSKAYWGYDAAFLARCRAVMTVKAGSIESMPSAVSAIIAATRLTNSRKPSGALSALAALR